MSGFWLNAEYTWSAKSWNKAWIPAKGEWGLGIVGWLGRWRRHFSTSNFFDSLLCKHKWMAQLHNIKRISKNTQRKEFYPKWRNFTPCTTRKGSSLLLLKELTPSSFHVNAMCLLDCPFRQSVECFSLSYAIFAKTDFNMVAHVMELEDVAWKCPTGWFPTESLHYTPIINRMECDQSH